MQMSRAIFLHVISMGQKLELLWNVYLKKLCQNCQEILEIETHRTLTRTNIPALSWILVLRNHNIVTNVWSNLPLKCHIFIIGNTHTQEKLYHQCDHIRFMLWWVCLEPGTTCRYHNMIKWHHHCTSVWAMEIPRLHNNCNKQEKN